MGKRIEKVDSLTGVEEVPVLTEARDCMVPVSLGGCPSVHWEDGLVTKCG